MLVRVSDYYEQFRCLAGACPHTCCAKWEVVIDEETACRYFDVPGPLGDKLRAALLCDGDGDFCFRLDGGRCPFLDGENLCEIHRQLGEAATSVTCREHPRFIEDYGSFREVTLSASCPAANALLLGSRAPLTFREWEDGTPAEEGDAWLTDLLPLRARMLDLLADRRRPLRRRMGEFLLLAMEAQERLDEDRAEDLPDLADDWTPPEEAGEERDSLLVPYALRYLSTLEALEPDWRDLLAQAARAEAPPVPEAMLERIAVYFAFRYLLKTVNDGDLLSRAQLCVLAVLAVERLAAVCGEEGGPSRPGGAAVMESGAARERRSVSAQRETAASERAVGEALRRFSCEIEHSDENLEALLHAFWQDEAMSVYQFLAELGS